MAEDEKQEINKSELTPEQRRLANLRPHKPGDPGGPGRPKGSNYKQRFKELLEKYSSYKAPEQFREALKKALPELPDNMTIEEAEACRVHLSALQGESWAYDRIHDKPAQALDHTTGGDKIGLHDKSDAELLALINLANTIDSKNE